MRRCAKCGKIYENDAMSYCNSCGGNLENFDAEKKNLCPSCGNTVLPGARFCNICGRPVQAGAPTADRDVYDRYSVPRKMVETRSNKKIMALLTILIVMVLVLVVAVVSMMAMRTDMGGYQQTNSVPIENEEKINSNKKQEEVTTEKVEPEESKSSQAESVTPVQPAPQPKPAQPAPQPKPVEPPAPTKAELENSIDNYVQSFVLAMNYGDSTYMLDYVIPNSPIYRTQKEFIKNNWYEEYIDSYIVGDVKLEDSNTCVVPVYEIYNVQIPGENFKRVEQSVTYRMKRDSDSYWKVYDFVGSVKTH